MPKRNSDEGNFLEMTVSNIGFLLDRLGQDCHPLQFLRELTQNSIEAIIRAGGKGEIIWDIDWVTYDLESLKKLCITDNGDGMTGDELVKFINQLSSSMSSQSMDGNYGVGAKISAATRNPYGVLYLSWKHGEGSMIQMQKDLKTGQYGLKQWKYKDGSYGHYLPLEKDVKPDLIKDHGTKVVLLGTTKEINTMEAPLSASSPSRWISKYLNTRYFQFPEGINVKAREGWEYARNDHKHNLLRHITGQGPYLKQHSAVTGELKLNGAVAHWWILKEDHSLSSNSGYIEANGHIAALYQKELYELATGRSGTTRLQQFGVTFGYKLVVIYVEPTSTTKLTTNTARTNLLIENESLPWNDWAAEFRSNMPEEIAKLIAEKAAAATNTNHQKTIRERLKDIIKLYNLSRFLAADSGNFTIDNDRLLIGGYDSNEANNPSIRNASASNAQKGPAGNVYAVFEKSNGTPAKKVKPDPFPEVQWVTISNGTREKGDIEDRAAKFIIEQNLLLINADFPAFSDMTNKLLTEFQSLPDITNVVQDVVRSWFEQSLVETIIGVQSLINRKDWSQMDIDKALSEEALTSAVMQRYHIHIAVRRELSLKIGARK